MSKTRISLTIVVLILLTLAVLPVVLPSSFYENQLNAPLARLTHGSFKAEQISFEYTPRPALVIRNAVIDNDPNIAQIDRISVPVNAFNVLNWGKALRGIKIEGGKFSPSFAISLPQRLKPEADTPHLAELIIGKSSIIVGKDTLGPVNGIVHFDKRGQLAELMVTDEQKHLELHIEPKDTTFVLTLNATHWELPFGYPIKFDSLLLKGIGNSAGIVIEDIRADLYSGIVTGNAQLSWNDGWQLSGTVRSNGFQAEPFSLVFSKTTHATGRLTGEANFVYRAKDYPQLFDMPAIDAKLQLHEGVLHNFDLVTPLKSQGAGSYGGGQTRFDTLNTLLKIRPNIVQFDNTQIDGGKFHATGTLAIGKDQQLRGIFSAQLRSGTLMAANQVQVGGVLRQPQFHTGAAYRPRTGDTGLITTPAQ